MCRVCDIHLVEKYHDLETHVRGHNIAPFPLTRDSDTLYNTSEKHHGALDWSDLEPGSLSPSNL